MKNNIITKGLATLALVSSLYANNGTVGEANNKLDGLIKNLKQTETSVKGDTTTTYKIMETSNKKPDDFSVDPIFRDSLSSNDTNVVDTLIKNDVSKPEGEKEVILGSGTLDTLPSINVDSLVNTIYTPINDSLEFNSKVAKKEYLQSVQDFASANPSIKKMDYVEGDTLENYFKLKAINGAFLGAYVLRDSLAKIGVDNKIPGNVFADEGYNKSTAKHDITGFTELINGADSGKVYQILVKNPKDKHLTVGKFDKTGRYTTDDDFKIKESYIGGNVAVGRKVFQSYKNQIDKLQSDKEAALKLLNEINGKDKDVATKYILEKIEDGSVGKLGPFSDLVSKQFSHSLEALGSNNKVLEQDGKMVLIHDMADYLDVDKRGNRIVAEIMDGHLLPKGNLEFKYSINYGDSSESGIMPFEKSYLESGKLVLFDEKAIPGDYKFEVSGRDGNKQTFFAREGFLQESTGMGTDNAIKPNYLKWSENDVRSAYAVGKLSFSNDERAKVNWEGGVGYDFGLVNFKLTGSVTPEEKMVKDTVIIDNIMKWVDGNFTKVGEVEKSRSLTNKTRNYDTRLDFEFGPMSAFISTEIETGSHQIYLKDSDAIRTDAISEVKPYGGLGVGMSFHPNDKWSYSPRVEGIFQKGGTLFDGGSLTLNATNKDLGLGFEVDYSMGRLSPSQKKTSEKEVTFGVTKYIGSKKNK